MLQKNGRQKGTTSTLFVMLLFMVFVISMFFMVIIGARVYENIDTRAKEHYTGSVSLGYIINKVRQGDETGHVDVVMIEDTPALELMEEINGTEYVTWIYFYEGYIRELFTRPELDMGLEAGYKIVECDGLNLKKEGEMLQIETIGSGSQRILLALRSGRDIHE